MLLLALLVPLVAAGYRESGPGPSFSRSSILHPPGHHLEHRNNNGQFRPSVIDLPVYPSYPIVQPTINNNDRFFHPVLSKLVEAKPLDAAKYNTYLQMNNPKAGCYEECQNNLQVLKNYYKRDDVDCISECFTSGPVIGPQPVNPNPVKPIVPVHPQPVKPVLPVNPKARFYYAKLYEIPDAVPLPEPMYNGYAMNPIAGCFTECEKNLRLVNRHFKTDLQPEDCVSECYRYGPNSISYPHRDHYHHVPGDYGNGGLHGLDGSNGHVVPPRPSNPGKYDFYLKSRLRTPLKPSSVNGPGENNNNNNAINNDGNNAQNGPSNDGNGNDGAAPSSPPRGRLGGNGFSVYKF